MSFSPGSLEGGKVLGEYLEFEQCNQQRGLYLLQNPLGFAQCQGHNERRELGSIEERQIQELIRKRRDSDLQLFEQMQKAQKTKADMELEILRLEVEKRKEALRKRAD